MISTGCRDHGACDAAASPPTGRRTRPPRCVVAPDAAVQVREREGVADVVSRHTQQVVLERRQGHATGLPAGGARGRSRWSRPCGWRARRHGAGVADVEPSGMRRPAVRRAAARSPLRAWRPGAPARGPDRVARGVGVPRRWARPRSPAPERRHSRSRSARSPWNGPSPRARDMTHPFLQQSHNSPGQSQEKSRSTGYSAVTHPFAARLPRIRPGRPRTARVFTLSPRRSIPSVSLRVGDPPGRTPWVNSPPEAKSHGSNSRRITMSSNPLGNGGARRALPCSSGWWSSRSPPRPSAGRATSAGRGTRATRSSPRWPSSWRARARRPSGSASSRPT